MPPAATVTGPVCVPPGPTQAESPAATARAPACPPVRQGRVTTTANDFGTAPFPATSEALQVTTVRPIGKDDPEAGAQTGAPTPLPVSVADAVYVTTPPPPLVAFPTTVAAGTFRTGGVRSIFTASVWVPDEPPWSSLAEYVSVVMPSAVTGIDAVAPAVVSANAPAPVATYSSDSAQFVRLSEAVRPTVTLSLFQPAAFAGGETDAATAGFGSA